MPLMTIGTGEGGEFQASIGHAVMGGIITPALLTSMVAPVAYTYLDSWDKRVLRFFEETPLHNVRPNIVAEAD